VCSQRERERDQAGRQAGRQRRLSWRAFCVTAWHGHLCRPSGIRACGGEQQPPLAIMQTERHRCPCPARLHCAPILITPLSAVQAIHPSMAASLHSRSPHSRLAGFSAAPVGWLAGHASSPFLPSIHSVHSSSISSWHPLPPSVSFSSLCLCLCLCLCLSPPSPSLSLVWVSVCLSSFSSHHVYRVVDTLVDDAMLECYAA